MNTFPKRALYAALAGIAALGMPAASGQFREPTPIIVVPGVPIVEVPNPAFLQGLNDDQRAAYFAWTRAKVAEKRALEFEEQVNILNTIIRKLEHRSVCT